MRALLRSHYPMVDVDAISDEAYIELFAEMMWVREFESKSVKVNSIEAK